MSWNLKINGEKVEWQLSDVVAVVPPRDFPRPRPEQESLNGKEPIARPFKGKDLNGKYTNRKAMNGNGTVRNGKEPSVVNGKKRREQQDRTTFEQAGWQFIPLAQLPPQPDDDGKGKPRSKNIRKVFTTERGDVLIETDVATVQLNAATMTNYETAKKVLAEDGLTIIHQLSFAPHLYTVRLPRGRSLFETIEALQSKTHRYVFAEPSMLQRMKGRQAPNDPQLAAQWQHEGQFGLHSLAAWEITKGAGVCIAIIDNGMDVDHDDLRDGIKGGGYFENRPGDATATFVRVQLGVANPDFPPSGHGTACMGMAGARANNGIEGCGIAPESDLLAIACALDQTGSQLTLARAIEYAIDPRQVDPSDPSPAADVISCSLDTAHDVESVLRLAIDSAKDSGRGGKGVPVFWAVNNVDESLSLDRLCSLENVIAVGMSGERGGRALQCAHGPKLEFLAPGLHVLGPLSGTRDDWTGASFATPLAAGVAALVLQKHPDWFATDVLQRLRDTCDMPPNRPTPNDQYGHGRINAYRALHDPE